MGKIIKSYHAFTTFRWRGVMFLLLLALTIFEAAGSFLPFFAGFPSEFVVLAFWMAADVLADYWVFGGICKKGTGRAEYLLSSGKGMQLVRDCLRMDMARRVCTMLLFMTAACVKTLLLPARAEQMRFPISFDIFIFLGGFCVIVVTLNIVRHFGLWNYYAAASLLSISIGMFLFLPVFLSSVFLMADGGTSGMEYDASVMGVEMAVLLAALAAVAAALAVFTSQHVMRCVRGGYQDEK